MSSGNQTERNADIVGANLADVAENGSIEMVRTLIVHHIIISGQLEHLPGYVACGIELLLTYMFSQSPAWYPVEGMESCNKQY